MKRSAIRPTLRMMKVMQLKEPSVISTYRIRASSIINGLNKVSISSRVPSMKLK
jgi:hypothetical protein